MKFLQSKQNNDGFTLVELLIVIAIIIILTAVSLEVLFNARKESRDMARIAIAEQLKLGVRLYGEAFGNYKLLPSSGDITPPDASNPNGSTMYQALSPYIKNFKGDPLGTNSEYGFSYQKGVVCVTGGVKHGVIVVKKMENDKNNNIATCTTLKSAGMYVNLID